MSDYNDACVRGCHIYLTWYRMARWAGPLPRPPGAAITQARQRRDDISGRRLHTAIPVGMHVSAVTYHVELCGMDLKPLPVHVVVRDPVSLHGLEGTSALYRGLKTREKECKGRKKDLEVGGGHGSGRMWGRKGMVTYSVLRPRGVPAYHVKRQAASVHVLLP